MVASRGELTADLDCSGFDGTSVTVGRRLNMNGFTLTGHPDHPVVECERNCRVQGPGTITGGYHGVRRANGEGRVSLRVFGVTISGNAGAATAGYRVKVKDSTITNNGTPPGAEYELSGGLQAVNRIVVRNSTIEDNLNFGIKTYHLNVAKQSSVINNGINPSCAAAPQATSYGCADIVLGNPPRGPVFRSGSVCLRSQRIHLTLGLNYGICLLD